MDPSDQELMSTVSEAHPDSMDFLSRAWCNFAVQAFQPPEQVQEHQGAIIPLDSAPHQGLFSMNDTDSAPFLKIERCVKMEDGDTKTMPSWGSNDQLKSWLWMQQALHPEVNYNGSFRKKWFPWKITPFKNMSMRKWLKEIKEKRKEEQRLQKAQVHAAVSIAGLAAALAAIAAEKSPGRNMDSNCCPETTSRDIAVASAAALVASQCAQAAELLGAKKEQISNVLGSAMNGTNTSDILTLTAAATTSLRGAATLKARTGYRNILNGSAPVLPIEEHNVIDYKDFDFEDSRSILAKGAQFNIETPDGKSMVRQASLHLSSEAKVILKIRKPNLLNVMTGKREYQVLDFHVELYKDTAARDDEIEPQAGTDSSTCYQMVLTTTKGSVKLDMTDDYQRYKMWATTITHMLMLSSSLNKYQHFSKYRTLN